MNSSEALKASRLDSPKNCHFDRSAAKWRNLLFWLLPQHEQQRSAQGSRLDPPETCHFDRSAAEWRNLLFWFLPQHEKQVSPLRDDKAVAPVEMTVPGEDETLKINVEQ